MKVTIFIDKKLRTTDSGVYSVEFSNGFFYIGGSKQLWTRIRTHVSYIRGNFWGDNIPKSLRKMKDFEGSVCFRLLEQVNGASRFGIPKEILDRERYHKQKYIENDFLLNRIEHLA